MTSPRIPVCPEANAETQPYWDGAAQGRLLLKHCTACGLPHYYPRAICPHSYSERTEWRDSVGTGAIYSFSVMRRVAQPYAIAYVAIDDGVTIMSNIVDCDFDALAIGQRVRVSFRASDGELTIPVFVPA
jgi:uncharacterized OB-fold protein